MFRYAQHDMLAIIVILSICPFGICEESIRCFAALNMTNEIIKKYGYYLCVIARKLDHQVFVAISTLIRTKRHSERSEESRDIHTH